MLRSVIGIFLILNILNLSVQMWTSSVPLVEINEEVEQLIEDPIYEDSEPLVLSATWTENAGANLYTCTNHRVGYFGCEYFEIDSPPPELI